MIEFFSKILNKKKDDHILVINSTTLLSIYNWK
jgi:hypothetical protein